MAQCESQPAELQGRGQRKRQRVVYDEDDESLDSTLTNTSATASPCNVADHPGPNGALLSTSTTKQRGILLSVKISAIYVKFVVKEEVIREILEYSSKLDKAKADLVGGERVRITDSKIRKEETVLQAFDYLVDGILEPLDIDDADKCLTALNGLILLYNYSIAMGIETLEAAILSHISSFDFDNFDAITLVYFATEYYHDDKDGSKAASKTSLGCLIKEYLAKYLAAIIEDGETYQYIKSHGGHTLNMQLLEVLSENYLAQRQAISSEEVKVET
ncbi:hypothetical protein LTR56_006853 [Elasticomyces elasticus]|nr:hypothetical protein LTR22_016686 [Elasticomyces elasticus]KAK3649377.1 hypothetical protein LTR56_006853 [Elasticomyces elasticus]KAK4903790.1 hypothetical protein LTR49_026636 [Elasticomyces elasticus]KAK5748288.1 hypothetical protein LTS12_021627 [Elasticomyces elasticus]